MTVIADRISRVLKTSSATQAVILISKAFYRVWYTGLLSKFRLYGAMKRFFILLSLFVVVKDFELFWSTSHFLSVPLILEYLKIFFPIFFALNEHKNLNKGVEKLKALSAVWQILRQPFNALNFWVRASFRYTENWNTNGDLLEHKR